ncbi:MAG: hypothetical protein ACRCYE_07220 [Sarcina sp.]
MKKKIIGVIILSTLVIGAYSAKGINHIEYKTLLANNITYADNNFTSISNANPDAFDNPQISGNGDLNRVPTTDINTQFGNMEIIRQSQGYECKNLSDPSAPVVYVGTINNIYQVGSEPAVEQIVSPKIIANGEGASLILPNVNTSQSGFGETYIEAVGANGQKTIVPYIYNVVSFKNSINVASSADIKNLTVNDVINNENNSTRDLKLYVANYTNGANNITIGLSRGMASIQQQMPLNIGNTNNANNTSNNNNTSNGANVSNTQNQESLKQQQVPFLAKLLLGSPFYIVLGIILCLIVIFTCFI